MSELEILKAIYVFSAMLEIILFLFVCAKCTSVIKRRYPSFRFPKTHWTDKAIVVVKVFGLMIIPILNLVIAINIIVQFDRLCEKAILIVEEKFELK